LNLRKAIDGMEVTVVASVRAARLDAHRGAFLRRRESTPVSAIKIDPVPAEASSAGLSF
jgi:hypothetical protein